MNDIIFKQNKKGGGLFNFIIPKSKNHTIVGLDAKDRLISATNSEHLDNIRKKKK